MDEGQSSVVLAAFCIIKTMSSYGKFDFVFEIHSSSMFIVQQCIWVGKSMPE
jgi:hypothetical protein